MARKLRVSSLKILDSLHRSIPRLDRGIQEMLLTEKSLDPAVKPQDDEKRERAVTYKLALGIEYFGAPFVGWQAQQGLVSVQQVVEQALSAVAAHPVSVIVAGRTDKGVHALEQVVHFATSARRPLHGWVMGANNHLPSSVRILWAQEVADEFNARFSAKARTYHYWIYNALVRSALFHQRCTVHYEPLDAALMHTAAQCLVGEHDFTSLRDSECQSKTPFRHIQALDVQRHQEWVQLRVTANAFLHHMVRNIVGVLLPVGEKKCAPAWVGDVLAARDRTAAGITAPPEGLYLAKVHYPATYSLPCQERSFLLV